MMSRILIGGIETPIGLGNGKIAGQLVERLSLAIRVGYRKDFLK
jgi:hypothetical protein